MLSGEGLSRVLCQHDQQIELAAGQRDRFALACHPTPVQINLQVSNQDQAWLTDTALHTTQNRAHTRHQLARGERFCDIVVCSQFQPDQAIHLLNAGSQHDDGYI